ncbi:MAG: hypothetical protein JWO86_1031 [Myxococcaceae bacterium]|jgi:hypothetical protein|nr:hypothetical protein [Myxococcaceae bacterium]MEA2752273.1 hypothetical protein [Myxococcales bacterium]
MRGSRVMANRAEIVKTGMIRAGKRGLLGDLALTVLALTVPPLA